MLFVICRFQSHVKIIQLTNGPLMNWQSWLKCLRLADQNPLSQSRTYLTTLSEPPESSS